MLQRSFLKAIYHGSLYIYQKTPITENLRATKWHESVK